VHPLDPDEFAPPIDGGRCVTRTRRVRLGDVTASGRARIDALARYLQDVAADDVDDAGVVGTWVVRRVALALFDLPRFGDEVDVTTFCTGFGSRWAERRTTVRVGERVALESVAIWVYVDESGRSAPLQDWFFDLYGRAAAGRKVSGRLRHPRPTGGEETRPWPVRATDFDVLNHVNNAASWQAVEEEIARLAKGRRLTRAEIEYRMPVDPGEPVELATELTEDTLTCWLLSGDEVRTSARVSLGERS
jgi:acyl-ACP thioesterase